MMINHVVYIRMSIKKIYTKKLLPNIQQNKELSFIVMKIF